MGRNLKAIISPQSIAIYGADRNKDSLGHSVFSNLLDADFQGVLYPVNPGVSSIRGVKVYPGLLDIPDPVDLAVIVAPGDSVLSVVEEAGRKKVKGLVVLTPGFKETGNSGRAIEDELTALAKKLDLPLLGPNSFGVINTEKEVRMNAGFAAKMPKAGNIGFISQSSALCAAVLSVAQALNIGFSKFIGFGNKAGLTEIDLLKLLKNDPETDVIIMYLEDISDGAAFIETAREIAFEVRKPMLAVKSGIKDETPFAIDSPPGSLAGTDAAYEAVFLQSGIQRVEGVYELFSYAQALANQPLPKGNRIAIVTNAGGPGLMAADTALRHGLKLAAFAEETHLKLKAALPTGAPINNPLEISEGTTFKRHETALGAVIDDPGVAGIVVILTPQALTDVVKTAEVVTRVAGRSDKPILCSFMGVMDVSAGVRHLAQHGLPNYIFPETAMRSMASMVRFASRVYRSKRQTPQIMADRDKAAEIIGRNLNGPGAFLLPQVEAQDLLACYGFPMPAKILLKTKEDLSSTIVFPAILDLFVPDQGPASQSPHKPVVKDLAEAGLAFDRIKTDYETAGIPGQFPGVQLTEIAGSGVEVLIRAVREPKFGPLCQFGLSGVLAKFMDDFSYRLAPMWESSVENMIRSIKAYKYLRGGLDRPPSDLEAIKRYILKAAQMLLDHPELLEVTLEPIIVYPEGQGGKVGGYRVFLQRPDPSK